MKPWKLLPWNRFKVRASCCEATVEKSRCFRRPIFGLWKRSLNENDTCQSVSLSRRFTKPRFFLFLWFIENDFGPNRKINDHLHVCGHYLETKSPFAKLLLNLNFMRYVVRSFSITIFWTDETQGEGPSVTSYTTLTLKTKQKLIDVAKNLNKPRSLSGVPPLPWYL